MAGNGNKLRSFTRPVLTAYRRVPVRWRLGGGSAALTFVILAGVAGVTDVLTDRHLSNASSQQQAGAIQQLANEIKPTLGADGLVTCFPEITAYGKTDHAEIRLFSRYGQLFCSSSYSSSTLALLNRPHFAAPPTNERATYVHSGYRVSTAPVPLLDSKNHVLTRLVYAEPLSTLDGTIREVRIYLSGGVVVGSILALLAGLLVAELAMRPVVELTEAAREIARTRDPTLRVPQPEADDEVAELARTLESMLGALDAARNESEAALSRQREFVADASHELRTPLTSVLANLELLADELGGEQADSAKSALRSTRRMRRLVADLLLLARADVGRQQQPRRVTDLGDRLTDAAAELGPSIEEHDITIDAEPAPVDANSDDLHRLILNLIENALNHTPPGTHICASTGIRDGLPTLVVEDDGPGITPELQSRVFERFVRGGGDTGVGARGTGLGLAIVDAVASTYGATVTLRSLPQLSGTRFEITFPPARIDAPAPHAEPQPAQETAAQTSTTTGRTIGRRRNRS